MDVSDMKVTDEDSFCPTAWWTKQRTSSWRNEFGSLWSWQFRIMQRKFTLSRTGQVGPIQGVQDCTCECPRSQAGYMVRSMHLTPMWSGWMLQHVVVESGARKNAHIEICDVVGTFFVSFNGVVQCTIDCSGHMLPTRTDRDVCVCVIAQCLSLIPCVFEVLDCNSVHSPFLCHWDPRTNAWLKPWIQFIWNWFQHCWLMHLIAVPGHRDTHVAQPHVIYFLILFFFSFSSFF